MLAQMEYNYPKVSLGKCMGRLQIRCSDSLVDRLDAIAARLDITSSKLAKTILERAVAQLEASNGRAPEPEHVPDIPSRSYETRTERSWLRLTPSEMTAVTVRAAAMGMTRYGWIARLIRAHLTKAPELSQDETLALREAIRELSYVGRNLNQVAHALNMTLNAKEKATVELIAEINEKVAITRDQVKAVFDQNLNRWGV